MGAIAPLLISSFFAFLIPLSYPSPSHPLPIGAYPLDEKLYISEVIKCKDGSNSFTRDRINDNFCDCHDGTDEPGTSACPAAKFYCKNVGSKPQFLFSSHVNDGICDCCDGSDEYHGVTVCPNSCIMGWSMVYHFVDYSKTYKQQSSPDAGKSELGLNAKDTIDKLGGLKYADATKVLMSMAGGGCDPDVDGYGTLIGEMCDVRMTSGVQEMLNEMMEIYLLHPKARHVGLSGTS